MLDISFYKIGIDPKIAFTFGARTQEFNLSLSSLDGKYFML